VKTKVDFISQGTVIRQFVTDVHDVCVLKFRPMGLKFWAYNAQTSAFENPPQDR